MLERRWQNEYRSTMVCIDHCHSGRLEGRLYNRYIQGGESFHSLMEMLLRMEELLDRMHFPEPYTARRGFRKEAAVQGKKLARMKVQYGLCGTFLLKVLFRQNASWQGSLIWIEGGQEESFRSVLELIHLFHSALQEEPDEENLA